MRRSSVVKKHVGNEIFYPKIEITRTWIVRVFLIIFKMQKKISTMLDNEFITNLYSYNIPNTTKN